MRIIRNIVWVLLLCLACGGRLCAQQLALKTNALMWAAMTPNIEMELVTGEHSSVSASVFGHKNPWGVESKLIGFQPEFRYWFNGRPMIREYIGIAAVGATYKSHLRSRIYDGDAVGLGLTMGYVLPLGSRFNVEFYGGFGAVAFWQKRYYPNDLYDDAYVDGNVQTNSHGYKLFPIKLGVSFSYIFK